MSMSLSLKGFVPEAPRVTGATAVTGAEAAGEAVARSAEDTFFGDAIIAALFREPDHRQSPL